MTEISYTADSFCIIGYSLKKNQNDLGKYAMRLTSVWWKHFLKQDFSVNISWYLRLCPNFKGVFLPWTLFRTGLWCHQSPCKLGGCQLWSTLDVTCYETRQNESDLSYCRTMVLILLAWSQTNGCDILPPRTRSTTEEKAVSTWHQPTPPESPTLSV